MMLGVISSHFRTQLFQLNLCYSKLNARAFIDNGLDIHMPLSKPVAGASN